MQTWLREREVDQLSLHGSTITANRPGGEGCIYAIITDRTF